MKLFDLHCDTVGECSVQDVPLCHNDLQVSLDKAAVFARYAQVFAIWIDDAYTGNGAPAYFDRVYDTFRREMRRNAGLIHHCTDSGQLCCGRMSAILSIENCNLLEGDLDKLDALKEQGVSLITLTWNGTNELGHGSVAGGEEGLSPFGKRAVRRMEDLGIIVDVSHLNDRGFYDVASMATRPFIASHSNARAVCGHPRNLTDDQIRIVAGQGGLIGLNLYHLFLGEVEGGSLFPTIERHLARILELGGEDVLAMGCDYDGAEIPPALDRVDKLEALYAYLLDQGFSQRLADKIFYQNACGYFTKWMRCGTI